MSTEMSTESTLPLDMTKPTLNMYEDAINQWALARNITPQGGATVLSQMSKMLEECAEFLVTYNALEEVCAGHDCTLEELPGRLAYYSGGVDQTDNFDLLEELQDDFGDMLVCLINAMRLAGTDMETCLTRAYDEIKDRKGTMINGKFVKE